MEVFEQYGLINQKKWTELLKALEASKTHRFTFPSIHDIRSFKAIAYSLNTDKLGRRYSIKANKENLTVEVTVKAL